MVGLMIRFAERFIYPSACAAVSRLGLRVVLNQRHPAGFGHVGASLGGRLGEPVKY